jgi:two-component system response regulator HydG
MTTMVNGDSQRTLNELLAEYERTLIEQALMANGGHQRRAARALGILPTTLHEKMKRLGLLRRADADRDEMQATA